MSEIIIHVKDYEMFGVLGIHPALELMTDVWRHHRDITMCVGIIEIRRFLVENPRLTSCLRIPAPYTEEELTKYVYRTIALAQVREIIRADKLGADASTIYLKNHNPKQKVRHLCLRGFPKTLIQELLNEMCRYLISLGFSDIVTGIKVSERNRQLLDTAVTYYAAYKLFDSSKYYIIV